jgi:glycine cleavage system aminomethyltransferase T
MQLLEVAEGERLVQLVTSVVVAAVPVVVEVVPGLKKVHLAVNTHMVVVVVTSGGRGTTEETGFGVAAIHQDYRVRVAKQAEEALADLRSLVMILTAVAAEVVEF